MKWTKWLLIILGCTILCLVIVGKFIFPEFTADSLNKVKKHFKPDQPSYFISQSSLIDSKEHEVKPLDKLQIQKMVNQLIPSDLGLGDKTGTIVLSSVYREIMKDFQEHLHQELPEGWAISRSTSNVNAIVIGDLFSLEPPQEKSKPTPTRRKSGLNILDRDGNPIPQVPIDADRNEPPSTHQKSNEKPRSALFLYWIPVTNPDTKTVLGATSNYNNPNLTAAIKDIIDDLADKNLIETENSLKVAVIATSSLPAESNLITASILEKMVNAKTDLMFLDKNWTSKYDSELRNVFWLHNNQKVESLVKKFSKSTTANAALIISQPTEGHFYLELMELPSLNILAIGRSENQPKE